MNALGTEGSIKGSLEACGHEFKVGLVVRLCIIPSIHSHRDGAWSRWRVGFKQGRVLQEREPYTPA